MTTTIMKDSKVGDAWIQEMCRLNPVSRVRGADGQLNGNITTGPVRLSFTDALFVAKPKMKNAPPGSPVGYGCTLLLTPITDQTIFWEEYNRICQAEFQQFWNGQYYAVDNPIRNCGEKPQFAGYTPGCFFTNVSSNFKPPIVDHMGNPIVDPNRVYPGVWAIVAVNAYASGKGQPKKGPRFGLQTIMIVGDDTNLGGAAPDPRAMFAGVNVRPPAVQPGQHFGQQQQGQPPGMPPGMPPQGGVGTFYPPSGPPPAQQGYAPPQGQPPGFPPQHQQPGYAPPYDPLAQFKG